MNFNQPFSSRYLFPTQTLFALFLLLRFTIFNLPNFLGWHLCVGRTEGDILLVRFHCSCRLPGYPIGPSYIFSSKWEILMISFRCCSEVARKQLDGIFCFSEKKRIPCRKVCKGIGAWLFPERNAHTFWVDWVASGKPISEQRCKEASGRYGHAVNMKICWHRSLGAVVFFFRLLLWFARWRAPSGHLPVQPDGVDGVCAKVEYICGKYTDTQAHMHSSYSSCFFFCRLLVPYGGKCTRTHRKKKNRKNGKDEYNLCLVRERRDEL